MDRVFIVEDDRDIAELIVDYFEMNGFEATWEANGLTALERARQEVFDIIILDIMLPGADGFEICKTLRKEQDVPILFVSARDSDIDVIRGLGLGADDYIKKPFVPGELVARATANLKRYRALKGSGGSQSQRIELGSIAIDLDAMRVFKDGKEIVIAHKEFELLKFFAQNPNKVFSREQLFAKVWDAGLYGDIGTVTVHIKRLREKIEADPNKPVLIETIWGAGYRLNL